jgi:hypothetical protein
MLTSDRHAYNIGGYSAVSVRVSRLVKQNPVMIHDTSGKTRVWMSIPTSTNSSFGDEMMVP